MSQPGGNTQNKTVSTFIIYINYIVYHVKASVEDGKFQGEGGGMCQLFYLRAFSFMFWSVRYKII